MKIVTIKRTNEIRRSARERVISSLQLQRNRWHPWPPWWWRRKAPATVVIAMAIYSKNMRRNRRTLQASNAELAKMNDRAPGPG